ncbi:unnamed protein product [Schistosoma curassoni]|uniref:Uncharacterized protein n=1 Tax=Schistosoma curassoni TaxID=6186 RepID=A0A183JRQ3_9TREM|nr:unnamed protein product [Schistosoma curassoni]
MDKNYRRLYSLQLSKVRIPLNGLQRNRFHSLFWDFSLMMKLK